jgi:hypothetical protein
MLTMVPPPACKRREMKSLFPSKGFEIAVRFAPSGGQGVARARAHQIINRIVYVRGRKTERFSP